MLGARAPWPHRNLNQTSQAFCVGCGGLSEGMHQAGAAKTKWAIEYWKPAADAFKLNNPDAFMYNGNCNVMLHRAMVKSDLEDQCDACDECREESAQFPEDQVARLPLPGEVEFICGGPPCQVLPLPKNVYHEFHAKPVVWLHTWYFFA